MTTNLILMTRETPLDSSTSPGQISNQFERLDQHKISSESQLLPSYLLLYHGAPVVPSHLEGSAEAIELREYEMIQQTVPSHAEVEAPTVDDLEHGRHLLLEAFTPAAGSDADFHKWYRQQHIPDLEKVPNYICTKRYRLIRSQANVGNLPSGKMHWASPPPYLALHEFGGETLEPASLTNTTDEAWDKKIREGLQSAQISVYSLHPRR